MSERASPPLDASVPTARAKRYDLVAGCYPANATQVEATARLVACLQPTGSKNRGHNAKVGCIAVSVVGGHTVYVPGMSVADLCARDLLQRLICLKYICSIIIPNACILRCTYVLGIMIQLTYTFKANYLQ